MAHEMATDCFTSKNWSNSEELSRLLDLIRADLVEFVNQADRNNARRAAGSNTVNGQLGELHHATALPPAQVSKLLGLHLDETPQGKDGLSKIVQRILGLSVNTWDQGFMHKLYAGTNAVGVMSELILAVLNTNLHVYAVSPALSIIEKETTKALANMFGFLGHYAGGISQPGGSASNFTSVLIARHHHFPSIKLKGMQQEQPVMFTSADSHYSLEKAAEMAGLGHAALWKIPVDKYGRMIVDKLRSSVILARKQGLHPFYVNATAGTTVRGAYDSIEHIADVCKQHSLWLHVDGSLGGAVVFSQRHSWKLKGAERADSITINPHKMLGVPVTCSFLLGRDMRLFWQSNSVSADYLFHEEIPNLQQSDPNALFDLADLTPQCGRKGDALKLALGWVYHGRLGYEKYINDAFSAALYLASAVREHPNLVLDGPLTPECVQVCFYYCAEPSRWDQMPAEQNTSVTQYIANALLSKGFMVDYATGSKGKFLRAVTNGRTTRDALNELIDCVLEIGSEL